MSEIKPKMNLLLPGEYCNNCPHFEPTVKKDDIYAAGIRIETLRNVVCENENLCKNIHDYLKKTFENEGQVEKTCDNCMHDFPRSPDCIGCNNKSHWREIDE